MAVAWAFAMIANVFYYNLLTYNNHTFFHHLRAKEIIFDGFVSKPGVEQVEQSA